MSDSARTEGTSGEKRFTYEGLKVSRVYRESGEYKASRESRVYRERKGSGAFRA